MLSYADVQHSLTEALAPRDLRALGELLLLFLHVTDVDCAGR
jgi:hypothetical protein